MLAQGQVLYENFARFSGVLCPQLEVIPSQARSSSQEEDSSKNGGGDEEDEDGDGDPQDVRQYLLLRVFSCRELTLQSKLEVQINVGLRTAAVVFHISCALNVPGHHVRGGAVGKVR